MALAGCSAGTFDYPTRVKGEPIGSDQRRGVTCELTLMARPSSPDANPHPVAEVSIRTGEAFDSLLDVAGDAPRADKHIGIVINCPGYVPQAFLAEWGRWEGLSRPTLDLGRVELRPSIGY